MESVKVAFGKAIKSKRIELKMSQEELAEKAELHRTYVSDTERGTRNISLINIYKLCDALEIDTPDLFRLVGIYLKQEENHESK